MKQEQFDMLLFKAHKTLGFKKEQKDNLLSMLSGSPDVREYPKTSNVKITPQGNKYTIVIKEGEQDRWLTVDEDTARELIMKLGSVLDE